ncbi:DNA-binding HxlR family transcriptional regulator [Haloferula luteola]|uniref:DNA-binding HxlR family transcriptional regulator n=1 Tax=Haloferula luteola TaxID=595692 RepID=A0A840V4I3_9BACT|nr:helix-turn-helix domain-containing protein [Haloferula luteola]MBB5352892.1 DNA-binding HxlR family transcriptional regulator [Haloferula luteola]
MQVLLWHHFEVTSNSDSSPRRSPCPVACSLDLFGDRWTLLVIRDLMFGATRFKDFTHSPEGIPTNILSDRLARLVDGGLAEKGPSESGGKRQIYRLTTKGQSLKPVLLAIRDWGLEWEPDTRLLEPPFDS